MEYRKEDYYDNEKLKKLTSEVVDKFFGKMQTPVPEDEISLRKKYLYGEVLNQRMYKKMLAEKNTRPTINEKGGPIFYIESFNLDVLYPYVGRSETSTLPPPEGEESDEEFNTVESIPIFHCVDEYDGGLYSSFRRECLKETYDRLGIPIKIKSKRNVWYIGKDEASRKWRERRDQRSFKLLKEIGWS